MPDQLLMMIYRKLWLWPCAMLAIPFAFTSALYAQGANVIQSSSPQAAQSAIAQVKVLTDRVAYLEQRLAALERKVAVDEASGLNNPQTATPVAGEDSPAATTTPGTSTAGSTPAAPSSGLSKADEARLADVEKQVSQLQQQQKSGETHSVSHPKSPSSQLGTTVTAPFEVVGPDGRLVMSVDAPSSGVQTGMTIYNPDGSRVQVGPGASSNSGVRIYDGGGSIRALMGFTGGDKPQLAIVKKDGSTGAQMIMNGDNAELDLYNTAGKVAALIGANENTGEGHAKFMDGLGNALALIGAAGTHGDVLLFGEGKRIPVWEFTLVGVR